MKPWILALVIGGLVFLSVVSWHPFRRTSLVHPIVYRAQINCFHEALRSFHRDVDRYPTDKEGLAALVRPSGIPGWKGPYLTSEIPTTPMGNPYRYRFEPHGYPIID